MGYIILLLLIRTNNSEGNVRVTPYCDAAVTAASNHTANGNPKTRQELAVLNEGRALFSTRRVSLLNAL